MKDVFAVIAKIKSRPTSVQARILKAMSDNSNVFVTFNERYADFQGHGAWQLREEIGKPRRSSLKRMFEQGWIQQYEGNRFLYELSDSGREIAEELTDTDLISKARSGWSAEMILSALRNRYKPDEWLWCEELHLEGYRARRIDAWAMRIVSGRERDLTKYLTRMAIEIKVDKSDFLNELKDPMKRQPAMAISNLFFYAAPAGLISHKEIPKECGLLEIHSQNRVVMRVRPPWRISDPPDWLLMACIARAMRK